VCPSPSPPLLTNQLKATEHQLPAQVGIHSDLSDQASNSSTRISTSSSKLSMTSDSKSNSTAASTPSTLANDSASLTAALRALSLDIAAATNAVDRKNESSQDRQHDDLISPQTCAAPGPTPLSTPVLPFEGSPGAGFAAGRPQDQQQRDESRSSPAGWETHRSMHRIKNDGDIRDLTPTIASKESFDQTTPPATPRATLNADSSTKTKASSMSSHTALHAAITPLATPAAAVSKKADPHHAEVAAAAAGTTPTNAGGNPILDKSTTATTMTPTVRLRPAAGVALEIATRLQQQQQQQQRAGVTTQPASDGAAYNDACRTPVAQLGTLAALGGKVETPHRMGTGLLEATTPSAAMHSAAAADARTRLQNGPGGVGAEAGFGSPFGYGGPAAMTARQSLESTLSAAPTRTQASVPLQQLGSAFVSPSSLASQTALAADLAGISKMPLPSVLGLNGGAGPGAGGAAGFGFDGTPSSQGGGANFEMVVAPPTLDPNTMLFHHESTANVYVNALPLTTTDDDLYRIGSSFGFVLSHKAIIAAETGLCKGYGFLLYSSREEAEGAIGCLTRMGLQASFAKESFSARLRRMADKGSANIYLSNLPTDMTTHQLEQLFLPHNVVSMRILLNSDGTSRGIGFVRLRDREIAQDCIDRLHGRMLPGCVSPLQVRFADSEGQKLLKRNAMMQNSINALNIQARDVLRSSDPFGSMSIGMGLGEIMGGAGGLSGGISTAPSSGSISPLPFGGAVMPVPQPGSMPLGMLSSPLSLSPAQQTTPLGLPATSSASGLGAAGSALYLPHSPAPMPGYGRTEAQENAMIGMLNPPPSSIHALGSGGSSGLPTPGPSPGDSASLGGIGSGAHMHPSAMAAALLSASLQQQQQSAHAQMQMQMQQLTPAYSLPDKTAAILLGGANAGAARLGGAALTNPLFGATMSGAALSSGTTKATSALDRPRAVPGAARALGQTMNLPSFSSPVLNLSLAGAAAAGSGATPTAAAAMLSNKRAMDGMRAGASPGTPAGGPMHLRASSGATPTSTGSGSGSLHNTPAASSPGGPASSAGFVAPYSSFQLQQMLGSSASIHAPARVRQENGGGAKQVASSHMLSPGSGSMPVRRASGLVASASESGDE